MSIKNFITAGNGISESEVDVISQFCNGRSKLSSYTPYNYVENINGVEIEFEAKKVSPQGATFYVARLPDMEILGIFPYSFKKEMGINAKRDAAKKADHNLVSEALAAR